MALGFGNGNHRLPCEAIEEAIGNRRVNGAIFDEEDILEFLSYLYLPCESFIFICYPIFLILSFYLTSINHILKIT